MLAVITGARWRNSSMRARSFWNSASCAPGQLALARHLDRQRIDEARIDQHLVVKVRAGGEAGRADIADDLALAHLLAGGDALAEAQHVAVGGVIAVGMADAHVVAVLALAARLLDDAAAGGEDGRAGRGGPVDAGVHAPLVEQRMEAHAEAGGEADVAAHRAAHEELLRVVAPLVVVVDDPVRRTIPVETIGFSAAGDGREQQFPRRTIRLRIVLHVEEKFDLIARTQPAAEVGL